jgi:hypothetical protein
VPVEAVGRLLRAGPDLPTLWLCGCLSRDLSVLPVLAAQGKGTPRRWPDLIETWRHPQAAP